jgi:hypothetical protein
MARTTLKSQAIVIDQLTAQVAELTTQVGVMMSALEESNQSRKQLSDERDCLAVRCDVLEGIVATSKPSSQPKKPAPKPLPVSAEVLSQPVVSITDADRSIWAKFQAMTREQRNEVYVWARATGLGHVGINNIIEVRAAWHEFQRQDDIALATMDYDFDEQYAQVQDAADMQAS